MLDTKITLRVLQTKHHQTSLRGKTNKQQLIHLKTVLSTKQASIQKNFSESLNMFIIMTKHGP